MGEYLWLIWPISIGIGLIVIGGVIASTVRRIRRSALGHCQCGIKRLNVDPRSNHNESGYGPKSLSE